MSFHEKTSQGSKRLHVFVRFMARKLRSTRAVTGCHVVPYTDEPTKLPFMSPQTIVVYAFEDSVATSLPLPASAPRLVFTHDKRTAAELCQDDDNTDVAVYSNIEEPDHPSVMHRILRTAASIIRGKNSGLNFIRWGGKTLVAEGLGDLRKNLQGMHLKSSLHKAIKQTTEALEPHLTPQHRVELATDGTFLQLCLSFDKAFDPQAYPHWLDLPFETLVLVQYTNTCELTMIWSLQKHTALSAQKVFACINARALLHRAKASALKEAG